MKTRLEIISKEGKLLKKIIPKRTFEGYLEIEGEGIVYCTKSPEGLVEIIKDKIARCPPPGHEGAEVKIIQEPEEQYNSKRLDAQSLKTPYRVL